MISADISVVLPELVLAGAAIVALMGAVYTAKDRLTPVLTWAMVALFLVLAFWIGTAGTDATAFGGMFVADAFARFAKVVVLVGAAAVLVIGQDYVQRRGLDRFEYPVLVALSVVGMMLMVSAGDLIALYVGLELQSLALYVIASLRRDSARSTEAGLKYFVLGSMSSGLLLFGASLIYGFAGTTQFAGILGTLEGEVPLGVLFGMVLLLSGLAFKVSAAPFHMWTPDVYEGSPTPVTAFFATAPKVAAMALFARVVHDAFGAIPGDWGQVIAVLAVLSMFLGAIAAIGQTDIKRLMAYSSIAHMGYAMIGLAVGTAGGVQAMLVYMAIYVTMNVGTFAFILSMERDGRPVSDIGALNQFGKTEPGKALALLVLMFSLAGVPPMLGFFAKLSVLKAAVDADMVWLAVAGAVASVIGAFYYLRIVYFMYFGKEGEVLESRMAPAQWALMMLSAVAMVAGIVNLFGIEGPALAAAQALVR
ncbi:NADH dehydrogenase subunit N [Gemmobacter megaterium]|uniref:NADH-quinone oxidoreductase subunit N n=1 Tax=Gemmobacter megaterium TaxID=1086013 RepID=A0A1N7KV30_9RHOB|nr:NADH-quinone oxidoreductase subunit NuoN [Gemmobacter megaterium]GGE03978.1 NADH-quinone oxidoreductase subunit N [Gemmobacter megaterium]SIS65445.1 NADH dehydrogenase subunit N [Gemmobacter megaterium]